MWDIYRTMVTNFLFAPCPHCSSNLIISRAALVQDQHEMRVLKGNLKISTEINGFIPLYCVCIFN